MAVGVYLYLWPHLYVVQYSISLVIVVKYYIVMSDVGSFLYLIETVLVSTGMSPLPCHIPPTTYWGYSDFSIHLSQTKINCWFFHFLYFFIWIKIKIQLIKNHCYYFTFNLPSQWLFKVPYDSHHRGMDKGDSNKIHDFV